jgi:hypothetical protein
MHVPACRPGLNGVAAHSVITCSPAGSITRAISAPGSMPVSLTSGLSASAFGGRSTEPFSPPNQGLDYLQGDGNLGAVQILLGHDKIENTVRYLGVDVEDALTLAERTEI